MVFGEGTVPDPVGATVSHVPVALVDGLGTIPAALVEVESAVVLCLTGCRPFNVDAAGGGNLMLLAAFQLR